jgi:hypothetical protein
MYSSANTHHNFFHALTPKKLNEFYHRATTGVLMRHINTQLQSGYCTTRITNNNKNWPCSIYINLFNQQKIKIGHISLHIKPDNIQIQNQSGRLHTRNNRNKTLKYPLIIEQVYNNIQNTISIKLGTPSTIETELEQMINTINNVLSSYFDPKSKIYLSNKLTRNSKTIHDCLNYVVNLMNGTCTPIRNTRKQIWKR